ncbi:protein kinase domain-containing protein [Haematococcus lacustris]|uniref:Protein kinase domain-containing protein n=1 Tax=Haematococcus lacustris TaxID=44745 RepID=A0A699YFW9_HAELA|nr:protein kinase domain-containing protein [Haematococcus lacustris]
MEFCEKGTLLEAIQAGVFKASTWRNARQALRALLRTAAEVAQGMLHLHMLGVMHGDLKPANIMLKGSSLDGRGFVAKVW